MTATSTSVLAEKIKCASFDVTIYPHLEELAAFLGKASALIVAQLGRTQAQADQARATMREAPRALSSSPDGSAFYWFGDKTDNDALLVSLTPRLTTALSACLLGGEFCFGGEEEPNVTALDRDLARSFALHAMREIDSYLQEHCVSSGFAGLQYLRSESAIEDALNNKQSSVLFSVSVDFQFDETAAPAALGFHFPIEFLEKNRLLEPFSRKQPAVDEKTKWRADLQDNMNNIDIELPIIIDRYMSTLSDLSRLEVGQIIPLEEDAHNSLDITLKTNSGSITLGRGRLGTYKKAKAVKIVTDLDPA